VIDKNPRNFLSKAKTIIQANNGWLINQHDTVNISIFFYEVKFSVYGYDHQPEVAQKRHTPQAQRSSNMPLLKPPPLWMATNGSKHKNEEKSSNARK
jgi:hypothetical protein